MIDTGRRAKDNGTCRLCGAAVVWGWTDKGRRMPLDPAEHPADDDAANVATYRDHLGRLKARTVSKDRPLEGYEHRRVPHFAICPPLVEQRERAASLRRAKRAAPDPHDPEALREARLAAVAVDPIVARDELAERRARSRSRHPAGTRRTPQ